jgi:hypothetical protein
MIMMSNKVIFLDNDGVICLDNNWGGRTRKWKKYLKTNPENHLLIMAPVEYRFDNFDKKAVKVLNEILTETGAEIIVSSDWRLHATLEELGDYYESQGIAKRPIGMTRTYVEIRKDMPEGTEIANQFYEGEFPYSRADEYEQVRHLEILQYLKDNPEITHWVAIDDLDMGNIEYLWDNMTKERKWGLSNFVRTTIMSEGIKQSGKKEKIINFLK